MTGSGGDQYLDFSSVDDLALAAERGRLDDVDLPTFSAHDIGPLFELSRLAASGLLPPARERSWLTWNGLSAMMESFHSGISQWVCPRANRIGYLRTRAPYDTNMWTAFGLATQRSAVGAGFPKPIAAQLTAALGELHNNIYEHSEDMDSGIIAFQARPGQFELAVVDGGIGVLQSLRKNPGYAGITDSGDALRLALTDGISRFRQKSARGYGFHPLFVGLANMHSTMRFRSGDHALVIDGRNPTLITARTSQKPNISGFLISVICAS